MKPTGTPSYQAIKGSLNKGNTVHEYHPGSANQLPTLLHFPLVWKALEESHLTLLLCDFLEQLINFCFVIIKYLHEGVLDCIRSLSLTCQLLCRIVYQRA